MKVIYIAGFRQHAGKTLTSLGIISQLLKRFKPEEIGYIKPVGQELVKLPDGTKIDKDATIIQKFVLPDIDLKYVSPVRLGSGVTKKYLKSDNKEKITADFEAAILEAMATLKDKKVVIAEGTGHPGVGGIVNLSNSRVAQLINAEVLYLAGGGIGKTLDMLDVDITYFARTGATVRGVVFNKLIPEKIEQMKEYITPEYLTERFSEDGSQIAINGFLPIVSQLNKPSMELIYHKFPSAIIAGGIDRNEWKIPSAGVTIISQSHINFKAEDHLKARDIVIISCHSERRLKNILAYNESLPQEEKIAGILFTCAKVGLRLKESIKAVVEHSVPALYVKEDTSSADTILYNSIKNTKLQSYDTGKYDQIKTLFDNYFDLDEFMSSFGVEK
jgi:BioD-like phosphotransacetylase family protein